MPKNNDGEKLGAAILSLGFLLWSLKFILRATVILLVIVFVLRCFSVSLPYWTAPAGGVLLWILYRFVWRGFLRLMLRLSETDR